MRALVGFNAVGVDGKLGQTPKSKVVTCQTGIDACNRRWSKAFCSMTHAIQVMDNIKKTYNLIFDK